MVLSSATRISFRLPASLEHRHVAIAFVRVLIEHIGSVDPQFRDEMITAFGEAFNNIVMHGYRDRDDGILEVEADLAADSVTLNLIDNGRTIDFSRVSPPDLDSMPEGGLGIFMIHALVDEVAYRNGEVNVLSLTKRTPG